MGQYSTLKKQKQWQKIPISIISKVKVVRKMSLKDFHLACKLKQATPK
jgi:hypothetical protein